MLSPFSCRTRKVSDLSMNEANWPPTPRGYFAIGAERMSKALNLGNLMRSAHGFGAIFVSDAVKPGARNL